MHSSNEKFEKKDLQHPVNYDWKTNFDYFWNTKSNQKEWVLPKVLKEQSEKNGNKDFLQFSYNNPLTYSEVNTLANQIANSLNKLGINKGEKFQYICQTLWNYVCHGLVF